jgi:hypothetical protein
VISSIHLRALQNSLPAVSRCPGRSLNHSTEDDRDMPSRQFAQSKCVASPQGSSVISARARKFALFSSSSTRSRAIFDAYRLIDLTTVSTVDGLRNKFRIVRPEAGLHCRPSSRSVVNGQIDGRHVILSSSLSGEAAAIRAGVVRLLFDFLHTFVQLVHGPSHAAREADSGSDHRGFLRSPGDWRQRPSDGGIALTTSYRSGFRPLVVGDKASKLTPVAWLLRPPRRVPTTHTSMHRPARREGGRYPRRPGIRCDMPRDR